MRRSAFLLMVVLVGLALPGCGRGSASPRALSAEEQQEVQQRTESVQKEEWDRHVQMVQKSQGASPRRAGTR